MFRLMSDMLEELLFTKFVLSARKMCRILCCSIFGGINYIGYSGLRVK